jgi:hypothetical protein
MFVICVHLGSNRLSVAYRGIFNGGAGFTQSIFSSVYATFLSEYLRQETFPGLCRGFFGFEQGIFSGVKPGILFRVFTQGIF